METIGDAYMCVSGVPRKNGHAHVREIAAIALAFIDAAPAVKVDHIQQYKLRMRGGMHSGPVAAGVIGIYAPRYCLFGDTVVLYLWLTSFAKPWKLIGKHLLPDGVDW